MIFPPGSPFWVLTLSSILRPLRPLLQKPYFSCGSPSSELFRRPDLVKRDFVPGLEPSRRPSKQLGSRSLCLIAPPVCRHWESCLQEHTSSSPSDFLPVLASWRSGVVSSGLPRVRLCVLLGPQTPKRRRSPPPKKTVFKKRTRQDDPSPIYSLPTSALERFHCIMSTDSTPHACALSFLSLCLGCTDNSGDAPWHRRAEEAANDHGTAHSRRDVNAHGRASVGSATLAQGRGIGADIAP